VTPFGSGHGMEQAWPELRMYMHLPTNTQIIRRRKKEDQPEIRFAIKQDRNHLTTKSLCVCVMQSIPNVPAGGRSNAAERLGPAGSSLDLSSACIYALQELPLPEKATTDQHLDLASMQGLPQLALSVEESHGKHIGRRG